MSDKIDQAVARVAQRQPKPLIMNQLTINVLQEPIAVRASGELSFTRAANADAAAATLLLWDPKVGAYRAVLTPPGTAWELVEKRQGLQLWKPGMRT